MLVGLCGRSGSGKGYVSKILSGMGIPCIDTDAVYRGMTGPSDVPSDCMKELSARFPGVLAPDNSLDRVKMRSLVFGGDRRALDDLNAITHKYILIETLSAADGLIRQGNGIVIIDAPLLYESGLDGLCTRVICVTAPHEFALTRIMKRDGISRSDAERRLEAQIPAEELVNKADYLIENDNDDEKMMGQINACVADLRRVFMCSAE